MITIKWNTFQFFGAWYGIQNSNGIEACEIFKVKPGTSASNYVLNTETRLKTNDEKFKTLLSETLESINIDQPGKMRLRPLPSEFFLFFYWKKKQFPIWFDLFALGMASLVSYNFGHVVDSNFTILKTDYETYAIVYRSDGYIYNSIIDNENIYSCSRSTQVWSRTPALNDDFKQKVSLLMPKTVKKECSWLLTKDFDFSFINFFDSFFFFFSVVPISDANFSKQYGSNGHSSTQPGRLEKQNWMHW